MSEQTPRGHMRDIVDAARDDIAKKYAAGQAEHGTALWTAGLGWYARAAREEALDLIAYTHCIFEVLTRIEVVIGSVKIGSITETQALDKIEKMICRTPPEASQEASPIAQVVNLQHKRYGS